MTRIIREFDARGRGVREVRAATSLRRAGVIPKCAVGLPRLVVGCEGDRLHTLGMRVARFAGRGPRSRDDVSCGGEYYEQT